ncbi:hypothetical protein O4215_20400 [Rhodococcus maanshanensis]|uniref:hypothetical protein n=1 Tax=Rhodococcus maanshanensis TaxID=183556 RepID=UPI0022B37227|nr:hypothetical protein [Rhodococcus maanshanensis]MCZ4557925.1 hypothetical protein [Rhodococcus maanshanensis]
MPVQDNAPRTLLTEAQDGLKRIFDAMCRSNPYDSEADAAAAIDAAREVGNLRVLLEEIGEHGPHAHHWRTTPAVAADVDAIHAGVL